MHWQPGVLLQAIAEQIAPYTGSNMFAEADTAATEAANKTRIFLILIIIINLIKH
jgi:hypothetical protein